MCRESGRDIRRKWVMMCCFPALLGREFLGGHVCLGDDYDVDAAKRSLSGRCRGLVSIYSSELKLRGRRRRKFDQRITKS